MLQKFVEKSQMLFTCARRGHTVKPRRRVRALRNHLGPTKILGQQKINHGSYSLLYVNWSGREAHNWKFSDALRHSSTTTNGTY